jgi:hypothetical protein
VAVSPITLYQVTDRLQAGRTVRLRANAIGWPAADAVGEHVSVDVAIAA